MHKRNLQEVTIEARERERERSCSITPQEHKHFYDEWWGTLFIIGRTMFACICRTNNVHKGTVRLTINTYIVTVFGSCNTQDTHNHQMKKQLKKNDNDNTYKHLLQTNDEVRMFRCLDHSLPNRTKNKSLDRYTCMLHRCDVKRS